MERNGEEGEGERRVKERGKNERLICTFKLRGKNQKLSFKIVNNAIMVNFG